MPAYSPGGILNALAAAVRGSILQPPSIQRLRLGLPGSLILFATLTFVHQRQLTARRPPSQQMFFLISIDFTPTQEFRLPLSNSSPAVSNASLRLSPRVSHLTYRAAYVPFTPNNSEQRLVPTYYRGCWHVVSRTLFIGYRQSHLHEMFVSYKRTLQPIRPSSFTRRRSVSLSTIAEDS